MLEYRVDTTKFNKTKVELPIESISFVDLSNLTDDNDEALEYDGLNKERILMVCKCKDIDKVVDGGFVKTENKMFLDYGDDTVHELKEYNFVNEFQISGVNVENRSFSFYINKYYTLVPDMIEKIVFNETLEIDEGENILLYFKDYHYFDVTDTEIPIYFSIYDENGELSVKTVKFEYYSPRVLIGSSANFNEAGANSLFRTIFGFDTTNPQIDELYSVGNLSGVEIYRDNFLFTDNADYTISLERAVVNINVPFVSTFETNLMQMELLSEYFVESEKKKAINPITDIEKDVYYPSIPNNDGTFSDVYTIKFNLHFREHRGDDWLVDNGSFWNGVTLNGGGRAEIVKADGKDLTESSRSDLLRFLDFSNEDVHYQKNKLKKSFLRLMYFDSTNSANQNLIGYSTVFFDTGDMFAKYMKYFDKSDYVSVGADKYEYGVYNPSEAIKKGIRVDRESFDDNTRLSSQFIVRSKNTSKASSEGFYMYIWKDNSSPLPQDLYMKVEFNHAGYGRTIPFMMPYWDRKKWNNTKKGIKSFEEILYDWNDVKTVDEDGHVTWRDGTDGHYGIRQYAKFSYIHLKYRYDKDSDKHIYYLDPDTYGEIDYPSGDDKNRYIEINLYEAKVE